MSLERRIEEFLLEQGAVKVGFARKEALAGGPPSADLDFTLPGVRSAVSFALPFDRDKIRAFLAKKDRLPHEEDNITTNMRVTSLSWEVAGLLKAEGYEARGTAANLNYRKDMPDWQITMHPKISHRYVAVASGLGSFGWSGNVGIKGYGAAIILGTCVTSAELEPTPLVQEDQRFCDNCKLCVSACPMGMFEKELSMSLTLGGVTFTHAARKTYLLCQMCCGGFTGLHSSGRWSSWSPGRFSVPEGEKALLSELLRAMSQYQKWPRVSAGYQNPAFEGANLNMTCGNCQIVCWGDKKERAQNVKLLHTSGCIVQEPDGSLHVLPAGKAREAFECMDPEHRGLYC